MSIALGRVIEEARRIFAEVNRTYHKGRLPIYSLVEVAPSLPDAPTGALAQTDGPMRVIRLRTNMWPRDEGGFSVDFTRTVLAHESIHVRLFADGNPNWRSCTSQDFEVWRKRIPIAR